MSKICENTNKVEFTFESILENAAKIPGVKVNRNEFLSKVLENEDIDVIEALKEDPIAAGCTEEMLERLANKVILTRTSESSIVSFAAGIPGGIALAATIPADTLQFFGMSLRLAQELAYLYGEKDLWAGQENSEKVQTQLILYTGVMFGIPGAAAALRANANQALNNFDDEALTDQAWARVSKKISSELGKTITVDAATKGISKVIPVIGGVISGTLTFATMQPMGRRLAEGLKKTYFNYTEEDFIKDLETIKNLAAEVVDINCEEVEDNPEKEDVLELIEKLATLKEAGILTEDEFESKKTELLARI